MRWFEGKRPVALLLAAIMMLAGCGSGASKPGDTGGGAQNVTSNVGSSSSGPQATEIINVVVPVEPPTLDWQGSTNQATQQPGINIYETLYAVNKDYVAVPMLALALPTISSDKLTYTIPLRKGVKFHDGSEMKADDVIASLQRWGKVSSAGKFMFNFVAGIDKVNDYEIKIKLKELFGPLVNSLATPIEAAAIMPKGIADAAGANQIKEDSQIIGTGPLKLVKWERGKFYQLERFDGYANLDTNDGGLAGKKKVYAKQVKVTFANDPSVRLNGVVTGQFDWADDLPGDYIPKLESAGAQKKITRPYYNRMALLNVTRPPFNNPKIRQAFSLALDLEQIMVAQVGTKQLYEMDGAIYMPEHKGLYTKAGTEQFGKRDVAKAKELLKEAGYKNEPIVFLTTKTYDWQIAASTVIAENAKEAGFNIQLEVIDWTTLVNKRKDPKAWDIFQTGFGAGYLEPHTQLYLNGSWPFKGYYGSGDAMNTLLTEWKNAVTDAERMAMMEKIQKQFYQDMPAVKYGNMYLLSGVSAKLKFDMTFYQPTWWNVWLEKGK
jgi:peptide/nickel transport system substrate-binding protein